VHRDARPDVRFVDPGGDINVVEVVRGGQFGAGRDVWPSTASLTATRAIARDLMSVAARCPGSEFDHDLVGVYLVPWVMTQPVSVPAAAPLMATWSLHLGIVGRDKLARVRQVPTPIRPRSAPHTTEDDQPTTGFFFFAGASTSSATSSSAAVSSGANSSVAISCPVAWSGSTRREAPIC